MRAALPEAREAQVELVGVSPALAPLSSGASATVQATVVISSVSGATRCAAPSRSSSTNVIQPWTDAQVLLVSNSPERLPFGKVLYNGTLVSGQVARLLYHHQNGSKTDDMTFEVTLSNPTRAPLTLWVTSKVMSSVPGAVLVMVEKTGDLPGDERPVVEHLPKR